MKKLFISICIMCTSFYYVNGQEAASLTVHDSRFDEDLPSTVQRKIKADFKLLSALGVPSPGYDYSTNITIAPWNDNSGGLNHQLNFNDYGILYRNGDFSKTTWNNWQKLVLTDMNGIINGNLGVEGQLNINGNLRVEGQLNINGLIRAKEVRVASNWADFVFKKDYRLPTLNEVEKHIVENGTLPNIPSESDVKANGVNLAEISTLLLQKTEELTLYIIQQEKRINTLQKELDELKSCTKF